MWTREDSLCSHLQHPNFNGELRVGCVCAERMTDDYINPQKTERELKNRLNRKKNFMRREWQERNQGKYVLRYKGENITIMKSKLEQAGVFFMEDKACFDIIIVELMISIQLG